MYDTILLPTDGSSAAMRTVDHVVPLAQYENATIVVLYVVDTRVSTAVGDDTREEVIESLRRDGERALARVANRLDEAGVDYETETREAHPHRGILFAAEDHDVDLIAMATSGRDSTGRGQGVGSVTERVLDAERWPVLVINVKGR